MDLQDLVHLQTEFHLIRSYLLHLHQRQCIATVPLAMQSHVRESGHPYILDPRRQAEPDHQTVQEEAQEQEQVTSPSHQVIQTQEEEEQDSMVQEGDRPQEEGIQAGNPGGSSTPPIPPTPPPGSTPPQQSGGAGNQVALHRIYLQPQLHPADQLIHGRLWTDPGNHCRSSCYPPTIRAATSADA